MHRLEGVVSNDHLFAVYLGECIAPYVALDPLKAALPVHRPSMDLPMNHEDCEDDNHDACRLEISDLHHTMQRRWTIADQMYREVHQNQSIKDLYSNLNYLNKLADQLQYLQGAIIGNERVRIAYTTSGRPTAAVVRDNRTILDTTLYQTSCRSEEEAHFLTALLNSDVLTTAAEAFMPRGLYGARHFHKHGWKLPIPRYDAGDRLHVSLSELGKAAEQECRPLIAQSDIMSRPAGKARSDAARSLLRHEWQPNSATARAIEASVAQLLSDPAQAALAERQMANGQLSP